MGLKHIIDWKLFETDAFARVGKKLWVNLKSSGVPNIDHGDERTYYFRRYEPENISEGEMNRLNILFNKFNNKETSIGKEIPSDNGDRVHPGAFSVRLSIKPHYSVPFNFYKRSDDWWLIWCKCRCNWVNVCNEVHWNQETTLYGSSIILCDSIEGIEEFLNDYNPNKSVFENDAYNIINDLMKSRKEYYEKIIRHSWDKDVVNRVKVTESFQKIHDMIQEKLRDNKICSNIQIKKSQMDYRILVEGDFFQRKRQRRIDFGIDILNDEWFLIHLNYGDGDYIFFKCDQFEGLEKFVEDLPTIALYYPLSVPN